MENIINALSWIDSAAATVWILLTIIMFWLLYKVYDIEGRKHPVFGFGVFLLILVWLYPLYTFFFNQLEVAFIGNLLTLWATIIYMQKLKKLPVREYKWMIPQIVWIIIATFYVGCMLVEKYQMA
ncbi:MAG: tryptophan-rich sensory protein [Eudoraea sp.]|nr:tryptophan-rich sensory protein [Eudoraea sp.]